MLFTKSDESAPLAADGSISVSATGGTAPYNYLWSDGQTNNNLFGLSPGVYRVTATDQMNCNHEDSIKIFAFGDSSCVLNISTQVIPESFTGAEDGIASALANGGQAPYRFTWSTGEQTSTIYSLTTGNYFVTITDKALCSVTKIMHVPVGPISVDELEVEQNVLVYPNPNNGNFVRSGRESGMRHFQTLLQPPSDVRFGTKSRLSVGN